MAGKGGSVRGPSRAVAEPLIRLSFFPWFDASQFIARWSVYVCVSVSLLARRLIDKLMTVFLLAVVVWAKKLFDHLAAMKGR